MPRSENEYGRGNTYYIEKRVLKKGSGGHQKISKIFLHQGSNGVTPASDFVIFDLEDEFQNSISPLEQVWGNFGATDNFDVQKTGEDKQTDMTGG